MCVLSSRCLVCRPSNSCVNTDCLCRVGTPPAVNTHRTCALKRALQGSAHAHIHICICLHTCTGDEPLRGGLVASGLLFGAQHMQALPSYHHLPSTPCICMCVRACVCRAGGAAAAALGDGLRLGSGVCALRGIRQSPRPQHPHPRPVWNTRVFLVCSSAPTSGCRCSYVSPL